MMIHDLGDESIREDESRWGREFVKQNVKVLSLRILDKTILLSLTMYQEDQR